ncbi:hypothetical protein [Enterococcus thailandicus]
MNYLGTKYTMDMNDNWLRFSPTNKDVFTFQELNNPESRRVMKTNTWYKMYWNADSTYLWYLPGSSNLDPGGLYEQAARDGSANFKFIETNSSPKRYKLICDDGPVKVNWGNFHITGDWGASSDIDGLYFDLSGN